MFTEEWEDKLFKNQERKWWSGTEIVNLNDPQPDPITKPEPYVRLEQEIKYPIDSKTIPGLKHCWVEGKYKISRVGAGKHCEEVEGYIGFNGNMALRYDEKTNMYLIDHLPTGYGITTSGVNSFLIAETICEEFVNRLGPAIDSEDPNIIGNKSPKGFRNYINYCRSKNANIKYDEWQKIKDQ